MNDQLSLFVSQNEIMPHDQNKVFLLLSLQHQYYQQICNKEKLYEYRRFFRNEAVNAFIYVTSPQKYISGYVVFGNPRIGSPEEISKIAESQKPGYGTIIYNYFKDLKKCYAIPLLEFNKYRIPLKLNEIKESFPSFNPPQSYIILNKHPILLNFLLDNSFDKIRIQ